MQMVVVSRKATSMPFSFAGVAWNSVTLNGSVTSGGTVRILPGKYGAMGALAVQPLQESLGGHAADPAAVVSHFAVGEKLTA